jgi:hypothetical protein
MEHEGPTRAETGGQSGEIRAEAWKRPVLQRLSANDAETGVNLGSELVLLLS